MLTKEDNELLTRVGPGTPMGDALRQYWIPVFQSDQLPEPDCAPKRVRLLGEDLIAYRDTSGRVGMLQNNCPHRGASLFFGRNEEDGLRCVYHGWKFDVTGACVDMPNEPPESNFKHKIQVTAYPCQERGGVIFTYMGPRKDPSAIPDLEWLMVPPERRIITMRTQECNWAQAFEGGIDSSHSGFLHSRVSEHRPNIDQTKNPELERAGNTKGMVYKAKDKHPRFETVDTDYGVLVGARRDAEPDSYYWRITQFLFPFYQMIPSYGESPTIGGHAWVPIDDYNVVTWSVTWHPLKPLTEEQRARIHDYPRGSGIHPGVPKGLKPATSEAWGQFRPVHDKTNDYGRDFGLERDVLFTGIPNLGIEDSAMQETMGSIYDRTKEHLGSSDTGIIQTRRRLVAAARALREAGTTPPGVDAPHSYLVRSAGIVLPRSAVWDEAAHEFLVAYPDKHYASA
jgi:phthalate 4,5-dioxygenase oxygenase subunit